MSERIRPSPLGAARARFLATRGHGLEPRRGEPVLPLEIAAATSSGYELDDDILYEVWELVRCASGLDPEGIRALSFLATALLVSQRRGSTRLPLERPVLEELVGKLGGSGADVDAVLRLVAEARAGSSRTEAVFGRPGSFKPLILTDDTLSTQRLGHFEERLVGALSERMRRDPFPLEQRNVDAALGDVLGRPPVQRGREIALSDEQQRAVLAAVRLPFTVISGGPGTGKTSIVVSILRMLLRLGLPLETVALAAPTGKAANRMDESIKGYLRSIASPSEEDEKIFTACPEPRTLHRLLGFSPHSNGFKHHQNNPLAERVVIVDEASMIDLFLVERLVRSVRGDARLILLGDAEQLPSVDAGAVLRDLVPPAGASGDGRSRSAVRLTQSYRMNPADPAGRNILSVANAINAGDDRAIFPGSGASETLAIRRDAHELRFERTELFPASGAASREAFLDRWYAEKIRGRSDIDDLVRREYHWDGERFAPADEESLRQLLRHYEAFRILCCTRSEAQATGAAAVNRHLHRKALESLRGGDLGDVAFFPGEPVMMQRNDYGRGIFNGDQGVILRVREGDGGQHFRAVFPRKEGWGVFHLEGLRPLLELSYAMTVHKSQGSEFDTVAVVLPEHELPLLTREILYTAVTRSRRSVVILGRREILEVGIRQRAERWSGVGERLAKP